MAPRIPQENPDAQVEDEEIGDDATVDDEAEGLGEDDGEGQDDGAGDDERAEEDDGQAPEGDGRSRVLARERPARETPLAKANRLAREARAETDRLSREQAELRAEIQRMRQPAAETPEQEAAKLALMEPEQRQEYRFNRQMEALRRQQAATQFQMLDATDKVTFQALAASNPLVKRVAGQVETELAKIRAQGQNVSREQLADYLLGKAIRERGPKAVQQQQRQGERRIQQQRARPSAGRSDQGADRGDARAAEMRRKRLEDVVF